jgi:branched-chain amino acid transport system permease protein|tara:strand:- start:316 stop:1182 length:867 start_codon:yes stop_codon:yes gene_type:complete
MIQYIFFGLLTGSILAIAASGFALIRQVEGFLNIAHGQYMLIGAIVGLSFMQLGVNVIFSGILATLIVGLIGLLLSWIVFEPLRGKGHLVQFFSSIGVAFVLYGLILATWTGNGIKVYPLNFGNNFNFGFINFTFGEIYVIGIAWSCMLFLHLFLTKTSIGLLIRAVANNSTLAKTRGVNSSFVLYIVWFLSSGLAGLSGVLVGALGSVHSELGWQYILTILAVSVMGGVGNLYGVLASGLILGLVMDLSSLFIPSKYGMVLVFSVIILILLFRPQGLFSTRLQQRES